LQRSGINKFHKQLVLFMFVCVSCAKSVFGPVMTGNPAAQDPYASTNSTITGSKAAVTPATTPTLGTSAASATCSASPLRSVYYGRSTVTQKFACDQTVASLALGSAPSFINGNASGTSVTLTGTAPSSAASHTLWIFSVNQNAAKTFSVTTTILDNSTLASTLSPPGTFDKTNGSSTSNNVNFDLGHKLTLADSWDGNIQDAALNTTSISSDIPSISLATSCDTASAPYVCNGSNIRAGLNIDNALMLKWPWSAFDQGSYYLDITGQATIEGGSTTLGSHTFSATIPVQSAGNVTITAKNNPDSGNTYDSQVYRYAVAISSQSKPLAPVIGVTYIDFNTTNRAYFQRAIVDRTAAPTGGSNGINQSATVLEQNAADSQDFAVSSLSDGTWAIIGGIGVVGYYEILYNHVADSVTAPSVSSAVQLTNMGSGTDNALSIVSTKPYTDGTGTHIGIAYVRLNSSGSPQYNLNVAKINPTGTNAATILDDVKYGVSASGGYSKFERNQGSTDIDRLSLRWISENGTGYFYLAYRAGTSLNLMRLRSIYSTNYGDTSATIGSSVFADADASSSDQTLDLSVGTLGGATVAFIVYRDDSGDCYFKRSDSSLDVVAPTKFTLSTCYNPTVQFNPDSGRFVITYSELNASSKYDIKTTEVTIGAPDTYSTPIVVVANLASHPVRLVTDYYNTGHWLAVFYRLINSRYLKVHGYHVSGR